MRLFAVKLGTFMCLIQRWATWSLGLLLWFSMTPVYAQAQAQTPVQAPPAAVSPTVPVLSPLATRLLSVLDGLPKPSLLHEQLRQASDAQAVDVDLLKAVIAIESGFNPAAVSSAGAVGLMQIMPATAARFGLSGDKKTSISAKLADPSVNLGIGSRYLNYLMQLFSGQMELALAAYKAGEGTVRRAGNQIPSRKETQDYVNTVMQMYGSLKLSSTPPAAIPPNPKIETQELP
jgi:soluble lytic murein transglycosylase-like protein